MRKFEQTLYSGDYIKVYPSQLKYGYSPRIFVSPVGFSICTCFILKAPLGSLFGFLHAVPDRGLTEDVLRELKLFKGGKFRLIIGSQSWPSHILDQLNATMEHIEEISISTKVGEDASPFFVSLFSGENKVVLKRTSHKDLLTYTAF